MKKDYLTIIKKHRMKNNQDRNGKNKSYLSTKNITELNELIYAGARLAFEKIGVALKSTKEKIKTWMGNSTGNADKKSTKRGKNYIKKEKRKNMLGQKGQTTQEKK